MNQKYYTSIWNLHLLGYMVLILCTVVLSGCAYKVEQRISSLESEMVGQRVLDMRVTRLEERMTQTENALDSKHDGVNKKKRIVASAHSAVTPTTTVARSTAPVATLALSAQPVHAQPIKGLAPLTPSQASSSPKTGTEHTAVSAALSSLEQNAAAHQPTRTGTSQVQVPSSSSSTVPAAQTHTTPALVGHTTQKKSLMDYKSGQAQYDAALAAYEARQYEKAANMFAAFGKAQPETKLMANVIYWQGECRYSLQQYPQAILLFKDVVSAYPKHNKAADALLKLGLCYRRLGDMDNAKFYLNILQEDFPRSHAAGIAKKYQ